MKARLSAGLVWFAILTSIHVNAGGIRVYDLEDGTSVLVKQHDGRGVIVIKGQCYLENQAVFNGEAAKVGPPTSNH